MYICVCLCVYTVVQIRTYLELRIKGIKVSVFVDSYDKILK